MNFYEITTRNEGDVVKTFLIQARDEDDVRMLTNRLLTSAGEKIMTVDDKTDLIDTLDVRPNEYMNRWSHDIEFVFWTGGRTPTVRKRSTPLGSTPSSRSRTKGDV